MAVLFCTRLLLAQSGEATANLEEETKPQVPKLFMVEARTPGPDPSPHACQPSQPGGARAPPSPGYPSAVSGFRC